MMIGPSDEQLVDALVERAQPNPDLISQEQLDHGWQNLQAPLYARRHPSPLASGKRAAIGPWLAGFATASAVAVLAAVSYHALSARTEPALQYVVEGSAARHGDAVNSPPGGTSRLLFSDQSRVEIGGSTTITVDALDAHGARIRLVDGAVDVDVKHRARAAWIFAAGPFHVKVKGTAFHLGFVANRGHLSVKMKSGLVEIDSPSDRTVAIGAGESLELYADPANREAAASPSAERLGAGPAPAEDLPEAAPAGGKIETTSARVGNHHPMVRAAEHSELATAPESIAWSKLLAQGHFADVVADAERRGLSNAIAQASATDLSALADSARYTKHYDLARQVLLAMRARFAGTEHARDASFFLGRLAESAPGQPEAALAWYDTYLSDAPRGLYASEALGREMTLLTPSTPERARKMARQYLKRFPHGPQAELARSLLESDTE